jgi:hypothetical protein
MIYLAPNPVKDLEDWFLAILRAAFPETVYVLIGYKEDEELESVPYDYIRIIYTGLTTNNNNTYIEQQFGFRIVYSCHLPATMLPHRRSLALMEKGRLALWQKIPPRPADSLPILLKSEKLAKSKDCSCGPVYTQDWQAYNRVSNILVPVGDPCQGANELDVLVPNPTDYVTPFNKDFYTGVNSDYDPSKPLSNGFNQPYIWVDGQWVINPDYDPNKETIWGNLPFILLQFIKRIDISVSTQQSELLWQGSV